MVLFNVKALGLRRPQAPATGEAFGLCPRRVLDSERTRKTRKYQGLTFENYD